MEALTDEQLINEIRQDHLEPYRILVDRHKSYIYTLIYRMVEHHETTEDLSQEVFVKLYRSIGLFRGDARFTTWLYRLAINVVIDHQRAQRRKPHSVLIDKVEGWFIDTKEQPEEQLLHKEAQADMLQMLSELPDKYRMILYLYHYKQLSYQEMSDATGLPMKTLETRLYRGKAMLKQKWLEVKYHESETSGKQGASAIFK